MEKLPKCIYGDGCLERFADHEHDRVYLHTETVMPSCSTPDCPLYRKVYEFIMSDQKVKTSDIKVAEKHAGLHYHPPVRSWSVARSRPPPIAHYRATSEKSQVPRLDLKAISAPNSPGIRVGSSPTGIKAESKINLSKSNPPKVNSITISPKRKGSSEQMEMLNHNLELLRTDVTEKINAIKADVDEIKRSLYMLREMLAPRFQSDED